MNFTIETLGCKVNQYESEVMLEDLEKEGFKYVSLPEKADILIINSFSFAQASCTESPEYKILCSNPSQPYF